MVEKLIYAHLSSFGQCHLRYSFLINIRHALWCQNPVLMFIEGCNFPHVSVPCLAYFGFFFFCVLLFCPQSKIIYTVCCWLHFPVQAENPSYVANKSQTLERDSSLGFSSPLRCWQIILFYVTRLQCELRKIVFPSEHE